MPADPKNILAPEPPTDAELQAHLEEVARQADTELASYDGEEPHRPTGWALLTKDWRDYVELLESMLAEHDDEFSNAISGGMKSKVDELTAQLSEKDKHILTLTDALEDHRKSISAQEEQDKADAEVELKKLLGEDLWDKDPDAPAKLHNLLEAQIPGPEAIAMLRERAGLNKFVPKGAKSTPSAAGGSGTDSYRKLVLGK